jgi:hypothetical protein
MVMRPAVCHRLTVATLGAQPPAVSGPVSFAELRQLASRQTRAFPPFSLISNGPLLPFLFAARSSDRCTHHVTMRTSGSNDYLVVWTRVYQRISTQTT